MNIPNHLAAYSTQPAKAFNQKVAQIRSCSRKDLADNFCGKHDPTPLIESAIEKVDCGLLLYAGVDCCIRWPAKRDHHFGG